VKHAKGKKSGAPRKKGKRDASLGPRERKIDATERAATERLAVVGGTLELVGVDGKGTRLVGRLPVAGRVLEV